MKKRLLSALLITQCAYAMEQTGCWQSANVVASLKELAAACVSKHCLIKDRHKIVQLPSELQETLKYQIRWNRMTQDSFPIIPLTVKLATMSPDTSTIAGIAQDPDGTSKLRFITISKEREEKLCCKFSGEMFPSADENRFVNLALHPVKQKLALAGTTPNVVLIEALENGLLNLGGRYTSERTDRLDILQWNPNGDILLAAGNNIVFIIPEDSNEQVKEIVFNGNGAITDAIWSESGKRILVKTGMYEVQVINWVNGCKESGFSLNLPNPPMVSVAWDDEEAHTVLLATLHTIRGMQCQDRLLQEREYCDPASRIQQIMRVTNRYLLVKTVQHTKHQLKILDRMQKRIFQLQHVVCNGALTLSSNKRFVYGSQVGDSLVDLSYLLDT